MAPPVKKPPSRAAARGPRALLAGPDIQHLDEFFQCVGAQLYAEDWRDECVRFIGSRADNSALCEQARLVSDQIQAALLQGAIGLAVYFPAASLAAKAKLQGQETIAPDPDDEFDDDEGPFPTANEKLFDVRDRFYLVDPKAWYRNSLLELENIANDEAQGLTLDYQSSLIVTLSPRQMMVGIQDPGKPIINDPCQLLACLQDTRAPREIRTLASFPRWEQIQPVRLQAAIINGRFALSKVIELPPFERGDASRYRRYRKHAWAEISAVAWRYLAIEKRDGTDLKISELVDHIHEYLAGQGYSYEGTKRKSGPTMPNKSALYEHLRIIAQQWNAQNTADPPVRL